MGPMRFLAPVLVILPLVRTGLADSKIEASPVTASDLPKGVTVRGDFQSFSASRQATVDEHLGDIGIKE